MTREIILFVLLLVALMGLVVYYRVRDQRHLKKRTAETLSPALREEIAKERQENLEKRQKFEEAMRKAGKGPL